MSKTTRLCVLTASLLSLLGALSSSAGAVTWHNSGTTTWVGSGAAGSVTVTSVTLGCTTATATGTVPALTVGATLRSSGTITFTGCTLSGQSIGVECSYTLTGTSQHGAGMGSAITGTTDVTCGTYIAGTMICRATGTLTGAYFNTVPASATLNTGGHVVYHNAPTGTCPMGNGDLAHLAGRTQTSTALNPPTITRTA